MRPTAFETAASEKAESLLSKYSDSIAQAVFERRSFENWIQFELFHALRTSWSVQMEKRFPNVVNNERCDLHVDDDEGQESWLELKVILTNYKPRGPLAGNRGVTQSIQATLSDLRRLKVASETGDSALLLFAGPLPKSDRGTRDWEKHLDKIREYGEEVWAIRRGLAWDGSEFQLSASLWNPN